MAGEAIVTVIAGGAVARGAVAGGAVAGGAVARGAVARGVARLTFVVTIRPGARLALASCPGVFPVQQPII